MAQTLLLAMTLLASSLPAGEAKDCAAVAGGADQTSFLSAGTVWWRQTVFNRTDYSAYQSVERLCQLEKRTIYDDGWKEISARVYRATFSYHHTVLSNSGPEHCFEPYTHTVDVVFRHNAFNETGFKARLEPILRSLGRVPRCLMNNLEELELFPDSRNAGGGNNAIGVGIDMILNPGQTPNQPTSWEELFGHEGAHVSLDWGFGGSVDQPGWNKAQEDDCNEFISEYGRDHPNREDVGESLLPWYAVTYRPERFTSASIATVNRIMPNRMAYFDSLNARCDLSPVLASGTCSGTPAPSCQYSSWGAWGACSATCGDGTQTRTRSLTSSNGLSCTALEETQCCIEATCPASCDDGLKNGNEIGVDCGGSCPTACAAADTCLLVSGLTDQTGFNGKYLPSELVHNGKPVWMQVGSERLVGAQSPTAWWFDDDMLDLTGQGEGIWGSCEASALSDCQNVKMWDGSSWASQPEATFLPCQGIPVDCVLSTWGNSGVCSNTCGPGEQQQTRTVVVAAQNGGQQCEATARVMSCNLGECPVVVDVDCVTAWGPWTQCSKPCGRGSKERVKVVDTPAQGNGKQCSLSTEIEDCNTQACDGGGCPFEIQSKSITPYWNSIIIVPTTSPTITVTAANLKQGVHTWPLGISVKWDETAATLTAGADGNLVPGNTLTLEVDGCTITL